LAATYTKIKVKIFSVAQVKKTYKTPFQRKTTPFKKQQKHITNLSNVSQLSDEIVSKTYKNTYLHKPFKPKQCQFNLPHVLLL